MLKSELIPKMSRKSELVPEVTLNSVMVFNIYCIISKTKIPKMYHFNFIVHHFWKNSFILVKGEEGDGVRRVTGQG